MHALYIQNRVLCSSASCFKLSLNAPIILGIMPGKNLPSTSPYPFPRVALKVNPPTRSTNAFCWTLRCAIFFAKIRIHETCPYFCDSFCLHAHTLFIRLSKIHFRTFFFYQVGNIKGLQVSLYTEEASVYKKEKKIKDPNFMTPKSEIGPDLIECKNVPRSLLPRP